MSIWTDIAQWHCAHQQRCIDLNRCVCGTYERQNADFEQRLKQAMGRDPEQFNSKEQRMQSFIGTKLVRMQRMTRQEYNEFRGWPLPADENGADEGYLVEYQDGGKPNTPHYAGYVSWSPKAQADAAYRRTDGMSFGLAIEAMKKGAKVARAGWNGKGMWLVFAGKDGNWSAAVKGPMPEDWRGNLPFIAMYTADKHLVPWLASQTDMLADDWQIVE